MLFQNNLHPWVNLDFKGKCRRSPRTSLKCSFHWGKADIFICKKTNGVPGQGQTYAPVRTEVATGSLHWRAGFTFCNLLLKKVNPWRVSRRQTPTCRTCGCIQWKDFYGQGQKGQWHSSSPCFSRKATLTSKFLSMRLCSQSNEHELRNINLQVLGKGQESTMCRCYKGPRLSQASHVFPVLCYQAMTKMSHWYF